MPSDTQKVPESQRWVKLVDSLRKEFPQLSSVLFAVDDFRELRLKARPDGSTLAILKKYGPDGGPLVCFGVGYDCVLALMAIESTIAGNNWRVDKPWQPDKR